MNKNLTIVILTFFVISLNAMDIPRDTINDYILQQSLRGRINYVGRGQIQVLPNGKKVIYGKIPYGSTWVNIIAQYNVDGTPDETFGPQGMQAE